MKKLKLNVWGVMAIAGLFYFVLYFVYETCVNQCVPAVRPFLILIYLAVIALGALLFALTKSALLRISLVIAVIVGMGWMSFATGEWVVREREFHKFENEGETYYREDLTVANTLHFVLPLFGPLIGPAEMEYSSWYKRSGLLTMEKIDWPKSLWNEKGEEIYVFPDSNMRHNLATGESFRADENGWEYFLKSYDHPDGKYSLQYPNTYQVTGEPSSIYPKLILDKDRCGRCKISVEILREREKKKTLEDWRNDARWDFVEDTQVGGQEAVLLKSKDREFLIKTRYILSVGEELYAIEFEADVEKSDMDDILWWFAV